MSDRDDAAIMVGARDTEDHVPRVVLHIGTMKTGTSYLQQVMARNSHLLDDRGIRYQTRDGAPGRAIRELVDQADAELSLGDAWMALAEEAKAWPGRSVVISNELLSFVSAPVARNIIESLRPAEVTVVVTARDLARLLPSSWQNTVKNGSDWSYATFVDSVIEGSEEPRSPAKRFWHHHDLTEILDRWIAAVGADHIVVIPVAPAGAPPDLLWQRFASVLDVDPEDFDATQDRRSNLSMGYPETDLVRQVNRDLRRRLDRDTMKRLVLRHLANDVLRPAPDEADERATPTLSSDELDWAIRRSRELAEGVTARGVRVIGSLDDLVPSAADQPADSTTQAQPAAVSAGVVRAVVALILRIAELEGSYDPESDLHSDGAPQPARRAGGGRRRAGQGKAGDAGTRMGQARRRKRRLGAGGDRPDDEDQVQVD